VNTDSPALPTPNLRFADLVELTKPRITLMVVITAAVGFLLADSATGGAGSFPFVLLLHTLVGTGLVAGSGSALNQVIEKDLDGRMARTSRRPLPAGRLDPEVALGFGVLLAIGGLAHLYFAVNPLTALLGAATLVGYLFLYTPLKRVSSLATIVGAAPGAVPPLMGWAGYADDLAPGAWALFGILFLWQLPHFLAIAWMYREDYAQGGYPMLPVVRPDGAATARQAVLWAAALVPLSLLPSALGLTGAVYAGGAFLLGTAYLAASIAFGFRPDRSSARRLLLTSVLYLPALLIVMLVDRLVA
jgi:heme o synthase